MDEVLSYWASREEEFPEEVRMREETGCCATYAFDLTTDPDTGGPHP